MVIQDIHIKKIRLSPKESKEIEGLKLLKGNEQTIKTVATEENPKLHGFTPFGKDEFGINESQ